jgi:energy-coupling factor transport system ATP-binding protein
MSDAPLIDIQQVSYSYPGRADVHGAVLPVAALRDVSLRIGRGEYVALLGHNGSGKSTLARLCNALLIPDRGRVLVAGRDTRDLSARRAIRDRVGMIFQNPDNQIIATVVEDDVAWALAARGMPAALIRERVAWAMAAAGIADLRGRPPHRLSGGQRQRLAIAGVLALRPDAIVADEATATLDPLGRRALVDLLRQLNREQGLTIVHITHLLEEAAEADRVAVMEAGALALDGPPAAIFADLGRLRRLRLAIPEPIELADRLRAAGVPIGPAALTAKAIAEELSNLAPTERADADVKRET